MLSNRRARREIENTRENAYTVALELAAALVSGAHDRLGFYGAGVIPVAGERMLTSAPATLASRTTRTWTTTETRGRTRTTVTHREPGWMHAGPAQWAISNRRLVAHLADGTLCSLWWESLTGVRLDLDAEWVALDGTNANHSPGTWVLSGPSIAPIAVAAVAFCFGTDALRDHPSLASLRHRLVQLQRPEPRRRQPAAIENTVTAPSWDDLLHRRDWSS